MGLVETRPPEEASSVHSEQGVLRTEEEVWMSHRTPAKVPTPCSNSAGSVGFLDDLPVENFLLVDLSMHVAAALAEMELVGEQAWIGHVG